MGTIMYLVGKVTNHKPLEWELIGVFDTGSAARRACRTVHYFVWPVVLNEMSPDETIPWSDAYYPLQQEAIVAGKEGR
jgi:hypothetical protein